MNHNLVRVERNANDVFYAYCSCGWVIEDNTNERNIRLMFDRHARIEAFKDRRRNAGVVESLHD